MKWPPERWLLSGAEASRSKSKGLLNGLFVCYGREKLLHEAALVLLQGFDALLLRGYQLVDGSEARGDLLLLG